MIILLDIDGVMVPASGWKTPEFLNDGFPDFSPRAIKSLNKIIDKTNASILLTTTHKSIYPIAFWRQIFAKRGINAKISKLRSTKINRKDEVLNWIKSHSDINNFIIIDDDKSLHDLPLNLKSRVIFTSSLVGLNEDLADQAIRVLRKADLISA